MASELCPRCSEARIGAFRFCRGCGYDFDAERAARGMARELCPQCAKARIGAFRFCRGCGYDFDAERAAVRLPAGARTLRSPPTQPAAVPVPAPGTTTSVVEAPPLDRRGRRGVGAPPRLRRPLRPALGGAASAAGLVAVATLFGAWFILLRPVALGGPASYVVVSGVSMEPRLHSGDLVIVQTRAEYRVGDVVAYRIPAGQPSAGAIVIHRIIGRDGAAGFVTQGDNKNLQDPWQPTASEIVGRSWLEVPGSGRLLLTARTPIVLATVLGALAGIVVFASGPGTPHESRAAGARLLARLRRRQDGRARSPGQGWDAR